MGGGSSKPKQTSKATSAAAASGTRAPVKRNNSLLDMVTRGGSSSAAPPGKVGELTQASGEAVEWKPIPDQFASMEEVTWALRDQGLMGSNLIIGIDFTKSNEWTGKNCFNGVPLHKVNSKKQNPYQQAVSAIAQTLRTFDEDNLIPCYGFGDALTNDRSVFSFDDNNQPCHGLESVLSRYQEIVPHVKLAGPTSFAPLIYQAIKTVKESGGSYHILVIVADGQVTRSQDLPLTLFSRQEQETMQAIVDASDYPLSIVLVGVGDGPWEQMQVFDDNLPTRKFDNFQFVNFTSLAKTYTDVDKLNAVFAVTTLMEVPEQYKLIRDAGYLNNPERYESLRVKWKTRVIDPPDSAAANKRKSKEVVVNELFLCPLTKIIMSDPVIASDGYTYDRCAIEEWLTHHNTSPMTEEALENTTLTPSYTLRSAIQEAGGNVEELVAPTSRVREIPAAQQ